LKGARTALLLLHIGALAVGAIIAGLAAVSVIDNFASDSVMRAAHRIASAAALFLVTVGFGSVFVLRGFTPLAPLLFALSFVGVGVVVSINTLLMAKDFAPSEARTLDYVVSISQIAAVCLLASAALIWTARRSRFPLA
jgi:hypothetical protein